MPALRTEPGGEAPWQGGAAPPEFIIVMNPGSGAHGGQDVRGLISSALSAAGRRFRFVAIRKGEIVQAAQAAARLAHENGGVLVAVGGDGTLNAAAQAAITHDCPMGLIAQGTFNLFSRVLGLPLDPEAALQCLLAARPEPVQVGWVNQRVFLVNASVGLYPQLLADREAAKQKLGRKRWIAMAAGLVSLLEWRLQLTLDVERDGETARLRTPSLFVCNNQLQLQRVGIDETLVAQVGEGRLAGIVVRRLTLGAKLRLLARAATGSLGEARDIDAFALRTLTVGTRSARKVRVATDGEVQMMELPLHFTVAPRPLQVLLPPPGMRVPVE